MNAIIPYSYVSEKTKVATLHFKIKAGAQPGNSTVSLTRHELYEEEEPAASSYGIDGTITVKAPQYTVTFDSQGGSAVASVGGLTSGTAISEPAAPKRAGYRFAGWYMDPEGTAAWDFSSTVVTANTTLYAKWLRHAAVISIGSVPGAPGATVQVPVTAASATDGIGSYGMQIDFDPAALEVTDIVNEAGDYFDSNYNNTAGWLRTAWADSDGGDTPIAAGDKLFTVTFLIKSGAATGDKELTVQTADLNYFSVTDPSAVEMDKTLTPGKVTISPGAVVHSVSVSPSNINVQPGGSEQFTATVDASGGAVETVTWSISDTSGKVSIDNTGYVTVATDAAPGVYTITAISTADTSKQGTATFVVLPTIPDPGEPGVPDAPQGLTANGGDGRVDLNWNTVTGATYYNIYMSTNAGSFSDSHVASVTDSTYRVQGLTNGTTYYFIVKAGNSLGLSGASKQAAATPDTAASATVPGAPVNVTAVAGNGRATVSFTAPSDNGGSAITGYEVTAEPGGAVAAGTSSPIVVTGLSNGTSYTFTVKAINEVGASAASAASNAVVPRASSSGGNSSGGNSSGSSSGGGSGLPSATTATTPQTTSGVNILVNGKVEQAGTSATSERGSQKVITIYVDQQKLEEKLAAEGQGAVVTIPVSGASDVVIGELNGQMVKSMESKQAVVELKTDQATYRLPAQQIQIDAIADKVGKSVALEDIKVRIEIAAATTDKLQVVESAAANGSFTLAVPPLDFTISAVYGDTTVEVSKFNDYVERSIVLPSGVDPNKITTGVVVDPAGAVRHVPTKVVKLGETYYAQINSLTNSTYAVVWNPAAFQDVSAHWSKAAVNDMGSRMVIEGTGRGQFSPDRDITRAEFAAILVRGLGLAPEQGEPVFQDVKSSAWYSQAVNTAYAYQLIGGYDDGTFRPNDKITREQAMVMLAQAMKTTGLKDKQSAASAAAVLRSFQDASEVAAWAQSGVADSVQAGIVSGRSATALAPKQHMTRAEVAAIIHRLLQQSGLI
ncbi:S-layer homology domain-containing protein [Paenibacillus medicaginis]|uniref:S-layer homology domain-containing protein n=1 Tax=Paenibacillus medicaginis TaxID=1470560 RepID=A0ABV5C7Y8_9BACL